MPNFKLATGALAGALALAFTVYLPTPSLAVGPEPAATPAPTAKGKAKGKVKGKAKGKRKSEIRQDAIYAAGYWAAKRGEYSQALDLLRTAEKQDDTRVQTMIGFSLRMLGHVDEAMAYYHAALAQNPDLTTTRQYLGEAHLQKADKAGALEQLAEIEKRCGTTCEDYRLLADAISRS